MLDGIIHSCRWDQWSLLVLEPPVGLTRALAAKIQGIRGGRYGTPCFRLLFGFWNSSGPEFLVFFPWLAFRLRMLRHSFLKAKKTLHGEFKVKGSKQNFGWCSRLVDGGFLSLGELDFCNPCIVSEFLLLSLFLHARQKVRMCVSELCTHSDKNFQAVWNSLIRPRWCNTFFVFTLTFDRELGKRRNDLQHAVWTNTVKDVATWTQNRLVCCRS